MTHREQNCVTGKTDNQPILRKWPPMPVLSWFSTVRIAAEVERLRFRRMIIHCQDTLTLWCTYVLSNLRSLWNLFIGTGL
jgi:hypothetical protein